MKQAISKAIEGGYLLPWTTNKRITSMRHRGNYSVILLDPSFWSSLGKALGWGLEEDENLRWKDYKTYMHSFIDHLIKGGTADKFFNNLLQ